jgi:predicted exporter
MTPLRRATLLVGWLAILAALSAYVATDLRIGTDLRLFMPAPVTAEQRLLLDQVGDGAASRLLLVALAGDEPSALAETSQILSAALREDDTFELVANGDAGIDVIPDDLLAYRYLLSTTLDEARFDAPFLRAQLEARLRDLSSPAAMLLEDWLPRDPTLEALTLAQSWQPAQEAHRAYDVWFTRDETRALLVVETTAPGFDPDRQREAQDQLIAAFDAARGAARQRIEISGPGAFSVLIKERTAGEAAMLGSAATAGMLLLLIVAYRRWQPVVLGALPLVSAGLAGLAAVSLAFDAVHGITLAFGFTLIGVAQDYPMHVFSHQHRGITPLDNVRGLWPTLATGVVSTCIAYLSFLVSGVAGLAQLACFTIAGLGVAALTTRFLLPPLMSANARDFGASPLLGRMWNALARLPRPSWLAGAILVAAVAAIALPSSPLWQNNLAGLTPIPPELLQRDAAMRAELGAPDVRYQLVVDAPDTESLLAQEEALAPKLQQQVDAGVMAGFDYAARYLPSRATQERRRAALPDATTLRAALDEARTGLPFKADLFTPFVDDVARARTLPPLTVDALAHTPLATRVAGLLLPREGGVTGVISLTGVHDVATLQAFARASGDAVMLLDLKQASEDLVARYRERILLSLGVAALLLFIVVGVALRSARRARRVLMPMLLTTVIIVGALHLLGIPLSLFHLIALVLAAGLGLDYALFFEHAADDPADQRRTLHAVLVCALSTLMVFALLASSSLPVLRAIGMTVTLGVISNFVLALVLTRPDTPAHD